MQTDYTNRKVNDNFKALCQIYVYTHGNPNIIEKSYIYLRRDVLYHRVPQYVVGYTQCLSTLYLLSPSTQTGFIAYT